jgi:hypothetical protein
MEFEDSLTGIGFRASHHAEAITASPATFEGAGDEKR